MGYLYQVGKTWYFGLKFNGKWIRRSTQTHYKEAARGKLRDAELRIAQGKPIVEPPPDPVNTFSAFVKEYLHHKESIGYGVLRDKHCLSHFLGIYGSKRLDEITRENVERFVSLRLSEQAAPSTVQREISVIKATFNQAMKWERFGKNPAAKVGVKDGHKPRERLLTAEEIERLIHACPDSIRELVETALLTGMRQGELLGIRERDCDFLREEIHVRESKNGDPRAIPMHPRVKEILWGRVRGIEQQAVFHNVGCVRNTFPRAVRRAGLEDVRFHDLRHCAASYLLMGGADVRTVMQILGHRDPRITLRIYARVSQAHMREAVNRLRSVSHIAHSPTKNALQRPVTS